MPRVACLAAVVGIGCASENIATLEIPGHPLGHREYHVTAVEIDGEESDGVGGSDETFDVAPGRHVVSVHYGRCVHGLDRYPFPTLKEMAILGPPAGRAEVETQVGKTYVLKVTVSGGGSVTRYAYEFLER